MAIAAEESGIRKPDSADVSDEGAGPSAPAADRVATNDSEPRRAHARRHRWLAIPAAAFVIALSGLSFWLVRPTDRDIRPFGSVVRFALPFPHGTRPLDGAQFAPSPDGTTIALAARGADGRSHLWIRRLHAFDWQELSRTDDASYPFWSPDGRHVGFFAERRLKRIDVASGVTQTVCDAPDGHGGTWGLGNEIVFAPSGNGPLHRVAASGGTPQPITKLDGSHRELAHLWPRFLPDGVRVMYFANAADPKQRGSYLLDLQRGNTILVARRDVATVPAGDLLLFSNNRTLVTQRFDASRQELEDDITAIAGADQVGGPIAVGPTFSATPNVLVYRSTGPRITRLTWLDRQGRTIGEAGMPGEYQTPAISPDGRRIAVAQTDDRTNAADIWVIDVERNTSTRLTFNPAPDSAPIWSPDGSRVAFASRRPDGVHVMATNSTGGGSEVTIATWPFALQPTDWSNDGRVLLFTSRDSKTGLDVWATPVDGDRKAWPLLQTAFDESDGRLSPDGRWLAYVSNESGVDQVYVRSFPEPESRFQISVNGGTHPHWQRDGRQLLFVSPDGTLTAVDVSPGAAVGSGRPTPVLTLPDTIDFAMGPGAGPFLVPMPFDEHSGHELRVIVNWMNELRMER
jgi:Tol biopolymer transport system component